MREGKIASLVNDRKSKTRWGYYFSFGKDRFKVDKSNFLKMTRRILVNGRIVYDGR